MGSIFLKVLLLFLILNSCSTPIKNKIDNNKTNFNNSQKIFYIPGFSKGDDFYIDGPLWFDGEGKVKEFNSSTLNLNLNVSVPEFIKGYKVLNGKISLDLKIGKNNSKYTFNIKDLNANLDYNFSNIIVNIGKTEEIFFSKSKSYINIKDNNSQYKFIIEDTGIISLNISSIPGNIILKNKKI